MTHRDREMIAPSGDEVVVPADTAPSTNASEVSNRPHRILVVDDFADNRELLRRRLCRRGYEVIEASDGFEALRTVEQEDVDLILLDIMMPGMEGTEVVEMLRKTRSSLQLPVIMVSAKDQSDDIAYCLKLGANDYITKPIDFTVALARIEVQLNRKQDLELSSRVMAANEQLHQNRLPPERQVGPQRESAYTGQETENSSQVTVSAGQLAYRDALTGLQSRASFCKQLEEQFKNLTVTNRELALLLIDLDRFKSVNDVHGHLIGDRLLQDVAARLCSIAEKDRTVARLGSDEFAILVSEDGQPDAAFNLGEKIIDELSIPFHVSGKEIWLTASCGIARAAASGRRPEDLLKASDLAMRRAKAEGRSRVTIFEPNILQAQNERSVIEIGLRRALCQGELEIYYQPIIRSCDHRISCFEALLRWNHPERGIIHPEAFIPIAEEVGLTNEIGLWVLLQACREATTWPINLHVAVNISPAQFTHPELGINIRAALEASGLPADRLELEITESCLFDTGACSQAALTDIRDLGVRVSIDDFGTGYSSMSYLREFPFDKLKIDRRFVDSLGQKGGSVEIVKAIAQLGIRIGIDTTAEGVDTYSQFAAVIEHGCSEIQGYYVSKPLTAADARKFLSNC